VADDPQSIRAYLARRDPKLGRAIGSLAMPAVTHEGDLYLSLIRAIVSQQLSIKAAATILGRVLDLFPDRYPTPALLAATDVPTLRAAGLSGQKAGYVHAIAEFAMVSGFDREHLDALDDEAVITHLTQIKGVGRWTVEMLLMFSLGRPDVFSPGDVGLQNAMKDIYGLPSDLKGKDLQLRCATIAERWAPHRTTASRYLWAYKATL
jgi:DNA-3-methyladenine glycosylase II